MPPKSNYHHAWKNIPISKFSISFRWKLSKNIGGDWDNVSRWMNIKPDEVETTSTNRAEQANTFLKYLFNNNYTVGDLNHGLKSQSLIICMVSKSDVNSHINITNMAPKSNYRHAWENVQVSKLSIKFRGDLAKKIRGDWKSVARYMDIEPDEIIDDSNSTSSIDLVNDFLRYIAEKGHTVGDINHGIKEQQLIIYMLEESDVTTATS